MATARILTKKFVAPIVEAHREEGRKQGVQQGIQQGREQGIRQGVQQDREQMIAAVREWNDRRLDAQKRGIPFDEPPPGV